MVLPFLLLIAGMGVPQQEAEIGRLQSDVQRLSSELTRTQALVQNELRPMCSSESRFQAGDLRIYGADTPIRTNLFSMVSTPADACLSAEIRITATFLDSAGAFVCSGTSTIPQSAHVQNTFLEFRPYELEVFLKWWDGPTLKQQALVCRDYQGNEMRVPTESAGLLRIYATVFPKRGGLSTSELQIAIPRFQRR